MRLLEISQLTVTLVLTGNETELEVAIRTRIRGGYLEPTGTSMVEIFLRKWRLATFAKKPHHRSLTGL